VVGHTLTLIMTHRTPKIRPAMTAIAAVLALSSTQLLAQTVTEPVTVAPTAPVPDVTPPATTTSEPSTTSASDPLAPSAEPTTIATKSSKSTTTRRAASVARPARAAPPVARASVAAPVAEPADTVAPAPVAVAATPPAPAPAAAVAATPPAQDTSVASNAMLPIAGAAGLGLLGLIGVGVAMRRRKRRAEDAEFEARQSALAEIEPTEAPAQVDPLFAEQPSPQLPADPAPTAPVSASECIDAAPGSHVEAACEGPTADNPSLSIKKRLKRAHFFDQREFLVAAGEAVPVAADAGLPDAVAVPEPAPPAREPA
jgi:hypothetical protein